MNEWELVTPKAEVLQLAQRGENNPNPVLEVHVTGTVTYTNPAAQAAFPTLPSLGPDHPILSDLSAVVTALRDEGKPSLQREVRADNRIYEQKIVMGQGSDFLHIYMNDVTERKQTEAELQMSNMSLVNLLALLHQSKERLHNAQSQLIQAEKMGVVGQLASGIAHEVKNPLGIIMQGINYLERGLGAEQDQFAEILQIMRDAVLRGDRIVRGLLDFSRPAPLELKPSRLLQVIEAAVELVGKQLAVEDIRIVKEVAPDLPEVLLDENQVKQAFINLILNAYQAMSKGGTLTIRVYLEALAKAGGRVGRRTTDTFKVGQTVLVCEFEDTGRGIPERLLSKVFDPFFTTNPPGRGTGLGLTITRTIIEEHRGLIELTSQEGRGTTVTMLLPIPTRRDNEPQEETPVH